MNKKIKIIELLNKIANGEKVPKIIKYNYDTFQYISKWKQYIKEGYDEIPLLRIISDYNYSGLNDEVEILEENIEEIEELNGSRFVLTPLDEEIIDRINKLVNATNKIRKDLNK